MSKNIYPKFLALNRWNAYPWETSALCIFVDIEKRWSKVLMLTRYNASVRNFSCNSLFFSLYFFVSKIMHKLTCYSTFVTYKAYGVKVEDMFLVAETMVWDNGGKKLCGANISFWVIHFIKWWYWLHQLLNGYRWKQQPKLKTSQILISVLISKILE